MTGPKLSPYVSIAWASCPRWAVQESADLIGIIESPAGRTCAVLIDVQGTGASPRRMGHALMLDARSMLSGGVSADLAVHALNQHLHSRRDGQVGAAILIASIAPERYRAELAGYGDIVVAVRENGEWTRHEIRGGLAGHDPGANPDCRVISLEKEAMLVVSSDGLGRTGDGFGALLHGLNPNLRPAGAVSELIRSAVARDEGRPSADMASIAIQVALEGSDVPVEQGEFMRRVNVKSARP